MVAFPEAGELRALPGPLRAGASYSSGLTCPRLTPDTSFDKLAAAPKQEKLRGIGAATSLVPPLLPNRRDGDGAPLCGSVTDAAPQSPPPTALPQREHPTAWAGCGEG